MIYVMGDIHGCKDKYDEMLEKISLGFDDALFVLGDVIDVGEDSIEILKDMMYRPGVYPVLGEHEYYAKKLFPLIRECTSIEEAESALRGEEGELFKEWLGKNSEKTVKDFLALSDEDKEAIIDFLEEFQPYEKLEVGSKTFILVHGGIRDFDIEKDLDDYAEEDFVFGKADYDKVYFPKGIILVTGHTPTVMIDRACAGKIYSRKSHLAIDCGCGYEGGRLACICLDKLKVYYC